MYSGVELRVVPHWVEWMQAWASAWHWRLNPSWPAVKDIVWVNREGYSWVRMFQGTQVAILVWWN